MINKTVREMEVGNAWDAFMTRKTLTTAWEPGFVPDPTMAVRFPPLGELIASLLYMELVSLLDYACESQLSPERSEKLRNLHNRINALEADGRVLEPLRLHALRE